MYNFVCRIICFFFSLCVPFKVYQLAFCYRYVILLIVINETCHRTTHGSLPCSYIQLGLSLSLSLSACIRQFYRRKIGILYNVYALLERLLMSACQHNHTILSNRNPCGNRQKWHLSLSHTHTFSYSCSSPFFLRSLGSL